MSAVRFLPTARAELREAVSRYNREVPGLGTDLADDVERALDRTPPFLRTVLHTSQARGG